MQRTANKPRRTRRDGIEPLERRILLSVIYVDDTAPGPARDGATWATAYTDLQAALDAAAASAGADTISVAAGTYRPTARSNAVDPRSAAFSLLSGVSILGGFPNGGGPNRKPAANVTTLSGDIGTLGSADDNSYHVVSAVAVNSTAVLDGFTVNGGNANGFGDDGTGGGAYNRNASPTLINCVFTGNLAWIGGGMYNGDGSSPTLAGCILTLNSADGSGGGMANWGSSPTLTNCTVTGNFANANGGGGGGGMINVGASPTLTNCAFIANSTNGGGGGMYNGDGSSPTLTNCTFSGNSAIIEGGGIANYTTASPSMTNSILWGNWSDRGGAGPEIANILGGSATLHHSLVRDGWPGEGNLDAYPLFVHSASPGPDGVWRTADDFADLRLLPGSPAIDAGDTAAVPDSVTTDLAGDPRVKGPAVDMGAYEYQGPSGTVYQAEDAAVTGGAVMFDHSGYTGDGFVDFFHSTGDAVEFVLNAPSAGLYELSFRYANNGTGTRKMGLYVNGVPVPGGVPFARTGAWDAWDFTAVAVPLAAGANRVRLAASGQSGPNLDLLSVRPADSQPAVYQAESATLSGAAVMSDVPGFTGGGFADYQHLRNDFVEFTVEAPAGGEYALTFRYANGSAADRPLQLMVDGRVVEPRLGFAPTGAWSTWNTATRPVSLSAGRHAVRLTAVGSGGPNLDSLAVAARPAPALPVTLQAEEADLSGPLAASDVRGYTGTGFADYQRGRGDSVEFTYEAPAVGDYVLGFRYANGGMSDRPLELRLDGAVALRSLSFAPTGRWSAWREATATVSLRAGVNKIRLTSIGSNGPNLDALTVAPATPAQRA